MVVNIKRRGLLSRGVILFHNNAHSHKPQLTNDILTELGTAVFFIQHLPPSNFHILGMLSKFLGDKRFGPNEEVINAMQKCLRRQLK